MASSHNLIKEEKLKVVTVNIPMTYIKAMDKLVEAGEFTGRSSLIRIALREFLDEALNKYVKLLKFNDGEGERETLEISYLEKLRKDVRSVIPIVTVREMKKLLYGAKRRIK